MKKSSIVLLLSALFALPTVLKAQGMYVDVNVGFGFPFNTNNELLSNFTSVEIKNSDNGEYSYTSTQEIVALSLGKGVNFGASFGYMFNKHVGAELQVSFLAGGATQGQSSHKRTVIENGISNTYTSTYNEIWSANMLRIIPSFVLSAGMEKINPYAKLGVIIGTGKVDLVFKSNNPGDLKNWAYKLNGGIALGLNTRLGVVFGSVNNLSYFAEVQIVSMNYAPTKGEMIEYTVNGVDELGTLTTRQKETNYVKKLMFDSEDVPNENQPHEALQTNLPFSSVGVNVGVRIAL